VSDVHDRDDDEQDDSPLDLDPTSPLSDDSPFATEHLIEQKGRPGLPMPIDEKWFAAGRDAQGANERLLVRVPPRLKDWLTSAQNNQAFPFKGLSHVIRWCLLQGLMKLDRISPSPTLSTQVMAMNRVLYEEEVMADFSKTMQAAENRIGAYIRAGAKGEASRVVENLMAEVEAMPECYWRGEYLRQVETRWGSLLRTEGVGVGLDHSDDDTEK
jgi:hypothetical protein